MTISVQKAYLRFLFYFWVKEYASDEEKEEV